MKPLLVVFVLVLLFAPVQSPLQNIQTVKASAACDSTYIVSPGESLSGIAYRCRISSAEILRLNPAIRNPDRIYVGQRLILKGSTSAPEEAAIPVTGDKTYVVRSGDTLSRIASRVGLSVSQIMWANSFILDPNRIYPGQKLNVPDPASIPREADWRSDRIARSIENQQGSGLKYQPKSDTERWIHVDLSTQTVHAYEGDKVVRSFVVSTGKSSTPTVKGSYPIWVKLRYDDMRGPGYNLKDVPYVMYFYRGYGLHGTYWHNNFGTPLSAGCVNLTIPDAAWLYDFASVGTIVNVE
jgi:lipoprotein-anchoring transpeptidase ErfK/SrfK